MSGNSIMVSGNSAPVRKVVSRNSMSGNSVRKLLVRKLVSGNSARVRKVSGNSLSGNSVRKLPCLVRKLLSGKPPLSGNSPWAASSWNTSSAQPGIQGGVKTRRHERH
jgi:hypothetical protein